LSVDRENSGKGGHKARTKSRNSGALSRVSKEQYSAIFENSQIGIYRTTPDGQILAANAALIHMLGYSTFEELTRRNLELEGYDRDRSRAEFKRMIETAGEVRGFETAWKKQDGTPIYVSENARTVRTKNGAVMYYDGTVEDITERKRSEEALARHAREMEALYATSLAINSQLDLAVLLQTIIERAASLLDTDMGGLYLVQPDNASLVLVVSHNLPGSYLGVSLKFGEGLSGQVALTKAPVMTEDYRIWDKKASIYTDSPFRRSLGVPLKLKNQFIGVVTVTDSKRTGVFSEDEIRLVSLFADQAVIAVENARLYAAAQRELADRKRVEGALRHSQGRLKAIFDSVDDTIFLLDPLDGRILEVNRNIETMFGLSRAEALETTIGFLSAGEPPYTQNDALEWIRKASQAELQVFEWKSRHKSGRLFWTEVNLRCVSIEDSDVVLMALRDIDDRKRAELVQEVTYRISGLAQSSQTLDELYAAIHASIGELMPAQDFYIATYDPLTDLISFPYEAGSNDTNTSPIHPGKSLTGYVLRTGKPLLISGYAFEQMVQAGEFELVGKPSVDWLGVPLMTQSGATIGVLGIETYDPAVRLGEKEKDVLTFVSSQVGMAVERKWAEEALRESEEKSRGLIENAYDGITLIDEQALVVEWNAAQEQITGIPKAEALGLPIWDMQFQAAGNTSRTSQLLERIRQSTLQMTLSGQIPKAGQYSEQTIRRRNGAIRIVQTLNFPIKTHKGYMIGGISRDITQEKQAAQVLFEREQRYRSIFEYAPVGIFQSTPQGKYVYVNPEMARLFGYESAQELMDSINQTDIAAALYINRNAHAAIVAETLLVERWKQYEILYRRKDGSAMIATLTIRAALDTRDGKTYLTGFIEDITERRRTEEALRMDEIRLQAMLHLNQMTEASLEEITNFCLEQAVLLTSSKLGYLALLDSEEKQLNISYWSKEPLPEIGVLTPAMVMDVALVNLLGKVVHLRKPIIHNADLAVEDAVNETPPGHLPLARQMNVPIFDGNKIVAVAGVGNKAGDYDQSDVNQLTLLVQGMWRMVMRKKAQEEIRLQAARAEALLRVAARLNAQLNLDNLLKTVCDEAAHALNTPVSSVILYDSQQKTMVCSEAYGLPPDFVQNFRPIDRLVFDRMIEQYGTLAVIRDLQEKLEFINLAQFQTYDLHTLAMAVMVREDKLVGAIAVASQHTLRQFSQDELTLLKGIGDQAAQAILNNRLFADVQRHLHYVRLLHEVGLVISASTTDLPFSLNVILSQVAAQLKVDAVDILLLNSDNGHLEYTAGCGFLTGDSQDTSITLEWSGYSQLNPGNRILQFPHLDEAGFDPARARQVKAEGFASYFGSPLVIKNQTRGLLEVFHRSPLDPDQEWLDFLEALSIQVAVGIDNIVMFENLQNTNFELEQAYDTTLEGWSRALDLRDRETEGHSRRVTDMTVALGQALGLGPEELVHLRRGALLHDIGKMGVPDEILRKPDRLTEDEWLKMRMHPKFAYDLLKPVAFLRPALDIPYCHHEKWDGTGYPRGLKGEAIPRSARIFAILDVWDALNADRPYSAAWPEDQIITYIQSQKGLHFDPQIVDVFMKNLDTFRQIK